jgi:phosphatidylglycerophosphate synthase
MSFNISGQRYLYAPKTNMPNLKMITKAQTEIDIAVILTPDVQGIKKVFGIPAVRRIALLCSQAGFDEIHIAGITEPFQHILSDMVGPERFHSVKDRDSMDEIAATILEGRQLSGVKKILILRAGVIIDKINLLQLVHMDRPGICYMESDDAKERIFLTPSRHFAPILKHIWSPDDYLEIFGDAYLVKGSSGLPCGMNGSGKHKSAERKLVSAIRDQTRARDGFMARHVSRHVSLVMSTRLAQTPITANHVTFLGAGIGLLGALFLAKGGYLNQLIGCLLFLFCIIIDGVDGEVARLKLQESAFGHKLDIINDNIVHVAIFSGLALGCYNQTGNSAYIHLLWVLLGGFALCGMVVNYRILKPSSEKFRSRTMARILTLMSNRDFAYLMVLLAAVGRLHWFLIGASFGSYIFAAVLWISTSTGKSADMAARTGSEIQID